MLPACPQTCSTCPWKVPVAPCVSTVLFAFTEGQGRQDFQFSKGAENAPSHGLGQPFLPLQWGHGKLWES